MSDDYKIQLVTDADFEKEVIMNVEPVLVDFYSPGCAPCQGFEMTLIGLKEEYKGKIKIVKYNINQNAHYSRLYGVRPTPTSIIFFRGQPVGDYVGSGGTDTIKVFVRDSLPGYQL